MSPRVLLLLTCLALLKSSLSQAPHDFDNYCRTYFRFADEHIFPDNWKILLDSHDYQNLIGSTSSTWATADSDGDGLAWTQRGGICQYDIRACNFREGAQSNWVFTQYVSYEEAQEIIFDITFRFTQCTSNPSCTNDFANVYRFDVTGIQNAAAQTNTANYLDNKMGSLQQVGFTDETIEWKVNRPSDSSIKGFYLGFEDIGTCGQIRRILAYHKTARGFRDNANLVTCPDTALPPSGTTQLSTTTCTCDTNAVAISELERSCNENGVCTGSPACACKPGFELGSDGSCTACPPGTFKATVSNTDRCLPCPLNSVSLFEAAEVCTCDCNTVRPTDQPGADCSRPPSSPVVAINNPPIIDENGLTIFWYPAAEDGGNPDTLHYNVYTYNMNKKEYIKANEAGIKLEPTANLVEFTLSDVDSSLGVVVTSATAATGDEESIPDLSQVQNRFIQFYVNMEQLTDTCTGDESSSTDTSESNTKSVKQETEPVPTVVVPTEPIDNIEEIISNVVGVPIETLPEIEIPPAPKVFFTLGSQMLTNGSTISLSDIGEGDNALLCNTDKSSCCRDSREGEFYYPDGAQVPVRAAGDSLYRNRGDGLIKLNYIGTGAIPRGQYHCEIPESNGHIQKLLITIQ